MLGCRCKAARCKGVLPCLSCNQRNDNMTIMSFAVLISCCSTRQSNRHTTYQSIQPSRFRGRFGYTDRHAAAANSSDVQLAALPGASPT